MLFIICTATAQPNIVTGFGYSKDLLNQKKDYNSSNQFTMIIERYWNVLVVGGTLKYYNIFQNDDRRLIYNQIVAAIGAHKSIDNLILSASIQGGFWEREKSISEIEDDEFSNSLLHSVTQESDRKGNAYASSGVKIQVGYLFETKKIISLMPIGYFEFQKNIQLFKHNEALIGNEGAFSIFIGGALCISF